MDIIFQLETTEIFQKESQEVLSSLYYTRNESNTQLGQNVYEKAKQELQTIISHCDFDIQNVIKLFNNKGWDQKRVLYFTALIEKYWSDLINAALNHYSSNYGETVTNFNWLVKFIFGTSELKTLRYPLLQLLVTTINKTGQNRITYDINKDMLLKMINVLENIS
ncbi:unnamed protein product [Arctia plantaginis]|uniref:Uncharacterized protein n=1 Tax=Arctia plantaginis TaxID=874455 RepID=A0A8S1AIK8_ARCPL|nr:unnamed protein product [Arctia plantaginis]CAB3247547.1 unnamed protein product [Arctia plantaginis]